MSVCRLLPAIVPVVFFLALGACASAPGLADLNADERARMAAMPVFNANGLPRDSYRVIGSVASVACKDAFVESEAITRLKIQAVRLGADAIINLKFETRDELDWTHDCWSTVVGKGEAVRITDSGAEKQPNAGQ